MLPGGSGSTGPLRAGILTLRCSTGCLAAGPVRMMTLAPELRARIVHRPAAAHGVTVSCGHTDARPRSERGVDRGARTVTHLFNAMRPFSHRDPGLVGAALARNDVVVQIILDGDAPRHETAEVISSRRRRAASPS